MPMFRRRTRDPLPVCETCGGVYFCKCPRPSGVQPGDWPSGPPGAFRLAGLERERRVGDEIRETADIRWGRAFNGDLIYLSHSPGGPWFVVKTSHGRDIENPWTDEAGLLEVGRLLGAHRRVLLFNTLTFHVHAIQKVVDGVPYAVNAQWVGGIPLGPNAPRHPAMGD